jgi:hypothetical protein
MEMVRQSKGPRALNAKDVRPTTANYAGGTMKQLIVVSLAVALMLSTGGFPTLTHAQAPGTDLKPTFISPTPGLYVNGWPAFTVSYPKEWAQLVPGINGVLRVGVPRPELPLAIHLPSLSVGAAYAIPLPLEEWAKLFMPIYAMFTTGLKVLSDKPAQLKDGTPAREIEMEYLRPKNDPKVKVNEFTLIAKKELLWVWVTVDDDKGRIGEDLKKYAYSLTFQPGREEPVPVPPDVKAFFDMWCADVKGHDVKTLMSHFSDRFLHAGYGRAGMDQFFQDNPASPAKRDVFLCEPTVTLFEPWGDRAYVDGFFVEQSKGESTTLKIPFTWQQIIKEQGQWKWFGNQK